MFVNNNVGFDVANAQIMYYLKFYYKNPMIPSNSKWNLWKVYYYLTFKAIGIILTLKKHVDARGFIIPIFFWKEINSLMKGTLERRKAQCVSNCNLKVSWCKKILLKMVICSKIIFLCKTFVWWKNICLCSLWIIYIIDIFSNAFVSFGFSFHQ